MKTRPLLLSALVSFSWVVVSPALAPPAFAQPAPDAKKLLADGDKAARAKDWATALDRYRAAHAAAPSAASQAGMAQALYQQGKTLEAYEAYDELLKTYGAGLAKPAKAEADTRFAELANKTGALSVRVNEAGAEVSIDDRAVGLSPVPALIRMLVGPHRVKVTKAGFVPFEVPADLSPNGTSVVEVKLVREALKGRLSVKEKSGKAVRVVVDGIDVGPAPWDGEVDPGRHEVMVRSTGAASASQGFDVVKGQTTEVELVAVPAAARLEVRTSDGKGYIFVDGKPVAEGQFSGEVSVGPHEIEVRREGFASFKKSVVLADKQSYAESVTLSRRTGESVGAVAAEHERPFEGLYGGFGLHGFMGIGGTGSELETNCSTLGAVSCDTPNVLGAGPSGYVGYTWNPVGFELFLAGEIDTNTQEAVFDGNSSGANNPLVAKPARREKFRFARFGGMGALRVRATVQGRVVRASFAAGLGLSYKQMLMERTATTTDGTNLESRYVPDAVSYFSPAVSVDAAVHLRLSQSTALTLGMLLWAESAGSDAIAPGAPDVRFSNGLPLATPRVHLASSAQVLLGPYIGMQFGP